MSLLSLTWVVRVQRLGDAQRGKHLVQLAHVYKGLDDLGGGVVRFRGLTYAVGGLVALFSLEEYGPQKL